MPLGDIAQRALRSGSEHRAMSRLVWSKSFCSRTRDETPVYTLPTDADDATDRLK